MDLSEKSFLPLSAAQSLSRVCGQEFPQSCSDLQRALRRDKMPGTCDKDVVDQIIGEGADECFMIGTNAFIARNRPGMLGESRGFRILKQPHSPSSGSGLYFDRAYR